MRKLSRQVERFVRWLDAWYAGPVLRVLCGLSVLLVPAAQSFKLVESPWWMIPFVSAALLLVPLQHYHRGAPITRVTERLAEVNGVFAGSIEVLWQELLASKGRQLDEHQAKRLCIALLHRIRDYAALALHASDRPKLRVTLAVPYASEGTQVDSLKVWCYDQPHQDTRHTRLPLRTGEGTTPGSPTAYLHGTMEIIFNVDELPTKSAGKRPYKSIVSIPLAALGSDGKPLGVVNIDADETSFFDADTIVRDVLPLVSPAMNTIGLVMLLRKKGAPYGFPK